MTPKICCFTGHRTIPESDAYSLPLRIEETLERLYSLGVREFRAGGAVGFDMLAALKVISFRNIHPDVRLNLILPCRDQYIKWSSHDKSAYQFTLTHADSVIYLHDKYTAECMHERNRALVSGAHFCVAYMRKPSGGTAYTVRLSERSGLRVINLALDSSDDLLAPTI